jgi:hypothetical protein
MKTNRIIQALVLALFWFAHEVYCVDASEQKMVQFVAVEDESDSSEEDSDDFYVKLEPELTEASTASEVASWVRNFGPPFVELSEVFAQHRITGDFLLHRLDEKMFAQLNKILGVSPALFFNHVGRVRMQNGLGKKLYEKFFSLSHFEVAEWVTNFDIDELKYLALAVTRKEIYGACIMANCGQHSASHPVINYDFFGRYIKNKQLAKRFWHLVEGLRVKVQNNKKRKRYE